MYHIKDDIDSLHMFLFNIDDSRNTTGCKESMDDNKYEFDVFIKKV